MNYSKIYQELRKKYTDEEIVDAVLIPADLTEEEKKKLDAEMKEIRMRSLQETTEEDRILAELYQKTMKLERQNTKK